MILLEVSWDNIFSLSKGAVDLKDRGLCLVTGENLDEGGGNGAGKSSFASKAILWTLYGQTAGGLKADAIINRHTKKKSGWGAVRFLSDDGEEYKVQRFRPSKLRLWRGEKEISAKKVATTQEMIDQALGRDYQTFLQTEMFGQGRAMSYAALSPADQKKVMEQILPIQTLDEWAEEAKRNAAMVKEKLAKYETAVEVEAGKLNTLQRQFEFRKQEMEKWTVENDRAIIDKQNQLERYSTQITKAKNRIEQIDTQLNSILVQPQHFATMKKDVEVAVKKSAEAEKKYLEAHSVWQQWQSAADGLKHTMPVKIESLNCPTCNRPWDEKFIADHNNNYEQHFIRWKEAEVNAGHAKDVTAEYHKHKVAVENVELELKGRLQEMYDEERKYNALMQERNRHETFLRGKPTELQQSLDTLMLGTNPHRDAVDKMSSELKLQRAEVTKAKLESEALSQEYDDLVYWHKVYSKEMKVKLFEAACPYLDHVTAQHLKALDNSQLHVQFSTVKILSTGETKEDFNVRCWNDTGGEGFDSLSGGEQQMISFAIGRALADLARTQTTGASEFQILDEPFTELDERNFEAVVNYLQKDIKGTVLLISNDNSLKGLVPNRIIVTKKNGISEVRG